MRRRRNKVEEITKQLAQQAVSTAAGTKALASIHAESESKKSKVDSLDEALKMSQKEISTVNGVVEEQRAR